MGAFVLRPVSEPTIIAELVSLPVRIASPTPGGVNHTEYVTIVAASCDQISHDFILYAPTVQSLIDRYNEASITVDDASRDSGDEAPMSGRVSAVVTRAQTARADGPQVTGPCDVTTPTVYEPEPDCSKPKQPDVTPNPYI